MMTNRVVLNSDGLFISRSGKNVLTLTDPRQFVFTTDWRPASVLVSGSVSLSIPASGSANTSYINFGKTFSVFPNILWFLIDSNGYRSPLLMARPDGSDFAIYGYIRVESQLNRFRFRGINAPSTKTYTMKYYVLEE